MAGGLTTVISFPLNQQSERLGSGTVYTRALVNLLIEGYHVANPELSVCLKMGMQSSFVSLRIVQFEHDRGKV